MRSKAFRSKTALILTILMLVTAATTIATAQTYTDLFNFDGWHHGARPVAPGLLAQGRDGNMYGTTLFGGTANNGVVFKITPTGKLNVVYRFDVVHGRLPESGLTLGTDGNFYGTTGAGGATYDYGTIFKITKSGSLTTLYSFAGGRDGGSSAAPPIQSTDGNFYGTTSYTIYKMTSSGTFSPLGSLPERTEAPLLQATNGNFYGTTVYGGKFDGGTVFKMKANGAVTILYSFDRATKGFYPAAPVIQGSDGNLYGTTSMGGSNGAGLVFKLTLQGVLTVLHNFGDPNYPNDGWGPTAGLVQGNDGNYYGVAMRSPGGEVIFRITAAGVYSILCYSDEANGTSLTSNPVQHTNGKIYGLTSYGGTHDLGVVYSFDLGLAPFVKTLPTSGKIGNTVGILGGGLTGTSSVSFNGTPATFTVVSDTYMKTTVPTGATSGFVTVTTPGGTLKSNYEFRVKP